MKRRCISPHDGVEYLSDKKSRLDTEYLASAGGSASETQLPAEESEAMHLDDLRNLLDFTSLRSQTEIHARFERIASALLHDFHFTVVSETEETVFEILELEFYLIKPGCHEDPFTHGSDEQRHSGRWYFHRAPRRSNTGGVSAPTAAGGYRGGTRKGLDLTLGGPTSTSTAVPVLTSPYFPSSSSSSTPTSYTTPPATSQSLCEARGGALLRTLRRVADSKIISGPSLLVDEILRLSGAPNIANLVTHKWNNDTSAFLSPSSSPLSKPAVLHLKSRQDVTGNDSRSKPSKIYSSPRIGLDLSHPDIKFETALDHPRVTFVSKTYRYFTHPHLLTANGRGQTFVGVYNTFLADDLHTSKSEKIMVDELVKITGLKQPTVVKYLADYKLGLESGSLKAFLGASGKGASASPASFLKMMGTLRRLQLQQLEQSPVG